MPAGAHDRQARAGTSSRSTPLDNRALANLCGPLDANLRQIEAALDVAIAHRGGDVHADRHAGAGGARGARRCSASTRAAEKPLSVDDIQLGLIELATQTQRARRGRRRRRAAAAHAPRRPARPHAEPDALPEAHPGARHHVRHRPGRHRQDLPRRRLRRRRARARRGQAPRAGAPRGRGRRAAGLPARRPRAEGRSRTCARSTTRCTT